MRCPRCGYNIRTQKDKDRTDSIKEAHPRAFQNWTLEEDSKLRQLINDDVVPEMVAAQLGRQVTAIIRRAQVLMIEWPKPKHEAASEPPSEPPQKVLDYL